ITSKGKETETRSDVAGGREGGPALRNLAAHPARGGGGEHAATNRHQLASCRRVSSGVRTCSGPARADIVCVPRLRGSRPVEHSGYGSALCPDEEWVQVGRQTPSLKAGLRVHPKSPWEKT